MQLDNTLITVRSRTNFELLDLSIILCRKFLVHFIVLGFLGWLPWLAIDFLLLFPASGVSIQNVESIVMFDQASLHLRFIYLFLLLFILQAPAAMLPLTYSLGQEMFRIQPTVRETIKNYAGLLGLKCVALGLRRGIIPGMIAVAVATYSGDLNPFIEFFLLPFMICGTALLFRAVRPFAPEVITLEQGHQKGQGSESFLDRSKALKRRMKSLHHLLSSELTLRFVFATCGFLVLAVIAVCSVLWFLQFVGPNIHWTWLHSMILIPVVCFFMSILATVFRFVSYIDTRILLEGWEVRLKFMSEAERFRID